MTLTEKIIKAHLAGGEMIAGKEIALKIDQTLTQDSTGTMAYLQLEAMGIDKVRTMRSVAYIDHNTLQSGYENADDHAYIQSVALKHGIYVSKPGNGICHQVHLERFSVPGLTLTGSDSHTPTCGGMGMLAIGAGGLDVAVAMGGGPLYINMPEVIGVELKGALGKNVAAKDIILEVLRILTVKGGVGKVIEYFGDGVLSLTVPERATITNMGAELGATTSIFPSDIRTKEFLVSQDRADDYKPMCADKDAKYDRVITIDLSKLTPLAAAPHSPDNIRKVGELKDIRVDQVCIGSCTNSSYSDMMKIARILKGRTVAPWVSLTVSPGSRQVLTAIAKNGALADIIGAGARILECACGPCIGMGQSPKNNAVSVRTFNRNFYARSGTESAGVYLTSCETAAATALKGFIADPTELDDAKVELPKEFEINDNLILKPADFKDIVIERGPNIKPFPVNSALQDTISGKVLLSAGDNITTDDIMPSNSKLLPFRSNIPHLSNFCFNPVDPQFADRAKAAGGGFIVAGGNYGQGSSREHAALVPLYLKIKAVLAVSFARIHKDNLVNSGILPLELCDPKDRSKFALGDELRIDGLLQEVAGAGNITVHNLTNGSKIKFKLAVSERQKKYLADGGLLNNTKNNK